MSEKQDMGDPGVRRIEISGGRSVQVVGGSTLRMGGVDRSVIAPVDCRDKVGFSG